MKKQKFTYHSSFLWKFTKACASAKHESEPKKDTDSPGSRIPHKNREESLRMIARQKVYTPLAMGICKLIKMK